MDSVNQIAIHDALKKRLETDPRSLADYRTQGNNPKKFHPESFSCHLELILSVNPSNDLLVTAVIRNEPVCLARNIRNDNAKKRVNKG